MEKSVTIVSALYYIGRDRWKHSAFPPGVDRYKSWVVNLLSLDAKIYFFVDDYYHDYIVETRKQYDPEFKNTIIKKIPLTDLYFYKKYYVPEACLMFSPEFRDRVFFHDSADMNYPLYHIINFSKIEFVKKAAEENPYNSTHFFWSDAGGMRDSREKYAGVKRPAVTDNIFNDKVIHFSHKAEYNIYPTKDEYFRSQDRNIQGTAWIVPKEKVDTFFNMIDDQVDTIIKEGTVGSDEKVYDFLHNNNKDFYQLEVCGWFEYFNVCNAASEEPAQQTIKEKENMTIKGVTITWGDTDFYKFKESRLYKSFTRFNPNTELINYHFNRNHYVEQEREYREKFGAESEYLLYKIKFLLDKLKDLDADYIIFCDASDVVCMKPVDFLPHMFDLNKFIIVGHEKNVWPMKERKDLWPNYTDYSEQDVKNNTYLNSGMVLAKRTLFIEMLQNMVDNVFTTGITTFNNDQGVYTYYYTMNLEPKIKLDSSNIFALNTYKRSVDEFYLNEESKLVSKETGVVPCFLHDNGWNHGSPKYYAHFELARLYSESYPHLKDISKERIISQSHQDYLIRLRDEFGFTPKVAYDVGACVMSWTTIAKEVWPNTQFVLLEAMEESEELFQETNYPYHIGVFSDVDDKEVTFYKNVGYPGGNSYYKENSAHSSMASVLFDSPSNQFQRKTITLDTVKRMKNLPYPDLLKIDVQGCEIDILKGCSDILQHVEHLIVELQHIEYNIGAQLSEDSIPIIEAMGFELVTPKFSLSSHADADYHFKRKR